jgi:flagellar biosynthesis protein
LANTDDDSEQSGDDAPPAKPAIAVALSGEDAEGTPKVVAKGKVALAEQILRLAFDHGVKVRQDADLAELLVAVDVESEIPLEALAAVAEILAYVYAANTSLEAAVGPDREPTP